MIKRNLPLILLASFLITGCDILNISAPETATVDEEKVLIKITVYNLPVKRTYLAGESFDPTGMIIKAHFSNGSVEIVPNTECEFSAITEDSSKVIITYQGKTAAVPISVSGHVVVPPITTDKIALQSPINDASVQILDNQVISYLNDFKSSRSSIANDYLFDKDACDESKISFHQARIASYTTDNIDHSKSKTTTLSFTSELNATKYVVKLSTKEDFSDCVSYETTSNNIEINNLLRNQKYFWKVEDIDGANVSEVQTFITQDTPRFIDVDKVKNVRDYGGYMTKSGKRTKQGLMFRGHELNTRNYTSENGSSHNYNLTDKAKDVLLNELGIKVEFDLRSHDELDPAHNKKSALGDSIEYKQVNSSSNWCPSYNYISGEKGKYNYHLIKDVFVAISEAAASQKPIYIHCMGGADRTGSIFFCLGGLLGMSFTDLVAEFELTSFSKNLRERDKKGSYSDFPAFIQGFYDDIIGFDTNKTHDIQTVIWNMFIKMGMTETQLNNIIFNYIED